MTAWAFAFGWNWLLVPVAIYLGRRFWFATREQPLKYLQHSKFERELPFSPGKEHGDLFHSWYMHLRNPTLFERPEKVPSGTKESVFLLDVIRRESMFPWRRHTEAWLVTGKSSTRESDGFTDEAHLHKRFLGMIAVAEARKAEVEELTK